MHDYQRGRQHNTPTVQMPGDAARGNNQKTEGRIGKCWGCICEISSPSQNANANVLSIQHCCRAAVRTSEISSSGCTSLIDIPELDSGFLIVGAADIVALADIDGDVETEAAADAEYAGNVGRTGPDVELGPADAVGLKSGPTGAEDGVTFAYQHISVGQFDGP